MPCPKKKKELLDTATKLERNQQLREYLAGAGWHTKGDSALDHQIKNGQKQVTEITDHLSKCKKIRNFDNFGDSVECMQCSEEY